MMIISKLSIVINIYMCVYIHATFSYIEVFIIITNVSVYIYSYIYIVAYNKGTYLCV